MKKLFLSLIVLCSATSTWAQFFESGDLFYKITSSTEPYTVEVVRGRNYDELTIVNIPDVVTFEGIMYSVTNIASEVFSSCYNLSSIIVGNKVETIGMNAFYNCIALSSVALGNNVKSLENGAFFACSSLTSINIPESMTHIGQSVFEGTPMTWENSSNWDNDFLYIDNCLISLRDKYFYGTLTLREGTKLLADYVCNNLPYVTSVIIPESLKIIPLGAFQMCTGLTSITIPNTVTSIGESAFEGCSYLKSITIGTNVTDIGRFAFAGCPSLDSIVWNAKKLQDDSHAGEKIFNSLSVPLSVTSITFGDSVEHIPSGMCAGMPNLTSVSMGKNVKIIGHGAFFDCTFLESLPIGESVEIIGGQAFQGCHRLKSITLPESLKIIGGSAFHVCTSLTSIVIPDSVTTIEGSAFESCSALESLTIGKSVNYIGLLVVNGCSSLKLIDCKATTPPNFDSMINMGVNFMNCPSDLVVYVPCGATNAYKNHQHWSYFGNQIKEASYTIDVYSQDSNKGHVVIDQNSICDGAQITAIPHEGYSFIQWTDGNTDNPRRFEITRDTTFTAVFDQIFKGQCGDSLYWHYALNTLTITGTGAMWDNRPWGSVVNEIEHVSLPTGLTYIGDDAFQDCLGLHNIDIPGTVNSIGDYSFNGCRNLTAINCYPLLPPYAETTSFSNYSAQLNAPCDSLEAYKYDMVFGQFRNFECIGSESTTTDGVSIEPTSNTATVTWPTEEGAETYTIEIMNGDEVFCLLTFNADGMLLNIAFAPSRNGYHHPAQYAEQTTNGLRFTITNLHEGTRYGYDITAKDEEEQTLSTYSGEFTTESLTAVENIILPDNNTHKLLRNGQLLIIRDGKTYNAMGQEM